MGSTRATGTKKESAATRKRDLKLEVARTARQKVERKIGKLREQLAKEETRLTKRIQRVEALQARKVARLPTTTAKTHPLSSDLHEIKVNLSGVDTATERHNGTVPVQRKRSHGNKNH